MGQLAHKLYCSTDGRNMIAMLAEEKKQQPSRIPHLFSASKQLAGKYILDYQPANKPKIEYLTLTPKDYQYRGIVYSDVNKLIKYFKEHYCQPPPHPVMPGSAQLTPTTFMMMTSGSMFTAIHPKSVSSPVEYNTQLHTVK